MCVWEVTTCLDFIYGLHLILILISFLEESHMIIENSQKTLKPEPQSIENDYALPLKLSFKTSSQKNASQEVCQEEIFIHLPVFCESSLRKFFGVVQLGKGERLKLW